MESKKINQLATELAPELSDLTIIGDPTTGISKKITLSQMASLFTGTVEEYPNLASFPLVGTADTIYIALDTNIIYRWNTSTNAYVELSPNIVTSLVFNDANGFDGTISLVGSTATLTITTALTQGSVGFIGASGALTQDNSNFYWDNTNKRLGINTNAPTTAIDVFGSGIIGRLNGTSTNNAFLGFASAGSNKWSIGNVQSDHRFRIYSEANTTELVSVLQTGEFGIGIANPLTKLHIFGGASALIANLDANTSVAKSISFRSGNSSRINLEVSGTESGSNAGADLFIRTYTDAGSLLATPFYIKRSNGYVGINTITPNVLLEVKGGSAMTTLANSYTNAGIMHQYNSTNILTFGSNGSGTIIQGVNAGTNAAVQLLLQPFGGSIGIGTITPARQLELYNSLDAFMKFNGARSGNSAYTIGTDAAGFIIYDDTNSAYRFILNQKGNVGIGTTPSNWNTSYKTIQIGASMSLLQDGTSTSSYWGGNLYVATDGNYKYTINGSGGLFGIEGGSLVYYSVSSGTAGATANLSERFNVSGTGPFRIYTPTGTSETLRLICADTIGDGYLSYYRSTGVRKGYIGFGGSNDDGFSIMQEENAPMFIGVNGSEKARITANGEFLMHSTTFNSSNVGQLFGTGGDTYFTTNSQTTFYLNRLNTNGGLMLFQYNSTTVGSISTNANSLPSDKNFKKDITDISIGLNFVTKLRPVHYRHNFDEADEALSNGIIAQEMEQSLLECGIEKNSLLMLQHKPNEKESESQYWVDYTKMIPVLIKAIQDQQAQIEELKNK